MASEEEMMTELIRRMGRADHRDRAPGRRGTGDVPEGGGAVITADTITDEQIRELRCATCGAKAACIGRYEDMDRDEPACNACCGHGCEDGHCDPLFDVDGDITQDIAWHHDTKEGTRMRARCAEILNQRTSKEGK